MAIVYLYSMLAWVYRIHLFATAPGMAMVVYRPESLSTMSCFFNFNESTT